jgi:hypothetical protein
MRDVICFHPFVARYGYLELLDWLKWRVRVVETGACVVAWGQPARHWMPEQGRALSLISLRTSDPSPKMFGPEFLIERSRDLCW